VRPDRRDENGSGVNRERAANPLATSYRRSPSKLSPVGSGAKMWIFEHIGTSKITPEWLVR